MSPLLFSELEIFLLLLQNKRSTFLVALFLGTVKAILSLRIFFTKPEKFFTKPEKFFTKPLKVFTVCLKVFVTNFVTHIQKC